MTGRAKPEALIGHMCNGCYAGALTVRRVCRVAGLARCLPPMPVAGARVRPIPGSPMASSGRMGSDRIVREVPPCQD
jgi:hypothetical protein